MQSLILRSCLLILTIGLMISSRAFGDEAEKPEIPAADCWRFAPPVKELKWQ